MRRSGELRSFLLRSLGDLPERTPLNPRVVGTLQGQGYRVEKVIFESRPAHHVTANIYIPEGAPPFPGVLLPCGHSDNGKAYEDYQRASILLAKNGMAVLCYDPIGQGERYQMLDAQGKPIVARHDRAHDGRDRSDSGRPPAGELPDLGRNAGARLPGEPARNRSRATGAARATRAEAR